MNLRTRIVPFIVAVGLISSAALTPTYAADPPSDGDPNNNQTSVTASITSQGVFEAFFCVAEVDESGDWVLGENGLPAITTPDSTALDVGTAPSAVQDGHATGSLFICYIDTHTYRPNFNVQVHSSDFTMTGENPIDTPIAASNFLITQTWDSGQVQWSAQGDPIGDISSFSQNGYVGADTLPVAWSVNELRSLDTPRTVQYGYNGRGTIGAAARFDVELVIPSGTAPGEYQSEMTLTIIAGTQSK